jgi:hypothetical protein
MESMLPYIAAPLGSYGIYQTSTDLGISLGYKLTTNQCWDEHLWEIAGLAHGTARYVALGPKDLGPRGIFHGPLDRIFWVSEDICIYLLN